MQGDKPHSITPKEPADPLPSWNDHTVKRSLVDFVTRVSTEGGREWVPPSGRIAVFDNDGTLWCERPIQFQLLFALDRLDRLAADRTEMREQHRSRHSSRGTSRPSPPSASERYSSSSLPPTPA
jgi:hypothetical protein